MTATGARALALALVAVGCALLGLLSLQPPAPRPADAPLAEFSAARAQAQLRWIAAEPRPIGSAAHARVRDRLVAELDALGFEAAVERGPVANRYGARPAASFAFVENVVARKAGSDGGPALVLMSHYDSRWHAPGAGDAGSGVATILEAARALGHTPLARDLMVVLTDGEEVGLLGAQRWVATLPELADVGLLLNFEARGSGGPAYMFETSAGNAALIDALATSVARPNAVSLGYEVYERMPNDTDFSVTKAAGIPGLNLAPIGGLFDYHSVTDTADNFDLRTLQQQGDFAVALARRFGAGPLPPPAGEDVVFFDLLGRTLVHYPVWLGHLFAGATLVLYAGLLWRLRRRALLGWPELARASGWTGALLLAAIGLGALGGLWIDADERRWWAAVARMDADALGWALVGAGAALLVATLAARGVALGRRRSAPVGWWALAAAGLGLWLLLGAAAEAIAPTASYVFVLPAAFALLGHHLALRAPDGAMAERAALAGAAPGWIAFASLLPLLHQALGHAAPALTAVIAALLPSLALPALRPLAALGRAAAALPLLGGLALLLVAASSPPWSARTPRPVDAFAIADHDAGLVSFASGDAERDAWQLGLVPADAEAHAAPLVPGSRASLWSAPAHGATLGAPPRFDAAREGVRVRGRFVPPPGAIAGSIWIGPDAPLLRVAIDGLALALPPASATGHRRLRWYALPPEGVTLELELERAAPLALTTLSLVPGFPAPHADAPAARLPATMPAHYGYGDATVVVKRFELPPADGAAR